MGSSRSLGPVLSRPVPSRDLPGTSRDGTVLLESLVRTTELVATKYYDAKEKGNKEKCCDVKVYVKHVLLAYLFESFMQYFFLT